MKKRIAVFIMTSLTMLILISCGGDTPDSSRNNQTGRNAEIKKQLLASIPEMDIYAYAHNIEGKTVIDENADGGVYMLGLADIYLEAGDNEPLRLYERSLARSEFRFYYGSFFGDNHNYIILIDYEHGGHGGGSESFTAFDGESYSAIPAKILQSPDCQLTGDKNVIVTWDKWSFEIFFNLLKEAYNTGNIFTVEDGNFVEYFYIGIHDLFDETKTNGQYTLCFKLDYVIENGEICVGAVNFVENEEYYKVY